MSDEIVHLVRERLKHFIGRGDDILCDYELQGKFCSALSSLIVELKSKFGIDIMCDGMVGYVFTGVSFIGTDGEMIRVFEPYGHWNSKFRR